jgi:hypothetical protein
MAGILIANVVVGAVAFKGTFVGSNVAQCESLMMRRVTGTPVRLKGKAFKVCVLRRIVLSLDALTIIPYSRPPLCLRLGSYAWLFLCRL